MEEPPLASQSSQIIAPGNKGLRHPLKALRGRDFRLLWVGQTTSSFGSAFQAVALPWLILSAHGSAIDLALTLLFQALPQAFLTLVGGLLVDRLNARSVLILADALRLVTAGLLALLASRAAEHLWMIWMVLALHGAGNALFLPATSSLAPQLVQADDLESANALTSAMVQIGPLVGYLPAGLLVAVGGPGLAFALNAGSYAVAVVLALLMRPLGSAPRVQRRLVRTDLRETAQYLRTVPWLLTMFLMDCLVAFAAVATNSIGSPLLAKSLHVGAQGYSVLAWSYSMGAVLGLLLPAIAPLRSHRGAISIACQGVEAVLMGLIAIVPFPLGAVCMGGWSALNGVLVVMTVTLIQQRTPTHMRGRMMAFWALASTGVQPLAQIAGGSIANAVGAQALFALAGTIVLLGAILGGSVRALRQLN